jgi:hypothetical protein
MKKDCLDIGVIQAFVDCELPQDAVFTVSEHLAVCDECLQMVTMAESETASAFSVMERELGPLVPTQRLWSNINEKIESERSGLFGGLKTLISTIFMSPSMALAASMVLAVTVAAVLFMGSPDNGEIATQNSPASERVVSPQNEPVSVPVELEVSTPSISPQVSLASSRRSESTPRIEKAVYRPGSNAAAERYFDGEEVYVKTISAMRPVVDGNKEGVLTTSERIAYERELAVIEDAISRTKKELKRNPKSESARQVLLASYQNKIDLLSSVVQREELIASLK